MKNLELLPRRVVEEVPRRILGALQLVDATTGLPLGDAVRWQLRGVEVVTVPAPGQPAVRVPVPFDERSVRLQRNRRGAYVVMSAPHFARYVETFLNPAVPPELVPPAPGPGGPATRQLQVQLAVADAGPHYLPRQCAVLLPRSLDPLGADNVFTPARVALFRSPSAPAHDGRGTLRVSVLQAVTGDPLPGVLLRVFRRPRVAGDAPLGRGMTDWRGRARGEALVAVPGLRRFQPGDADPVLLDGQPIELEAARDRTFAGAAGEWPDVVKIEAGGPPDIVRPPLVAAAPGDPVLRILRPAAPLVLAPGQEQAVLLEMP